MYRLIVTITLACMVWACSGKEEAAQEAARQLEEAAAQAARQAEQDAPQSFGEALQRVGEALGGGEGADPVAAADLKSLLPETLAGFERTSYDAQKSGGFGIKVSKAQAEYGEDGGDGDGVLSVMITDLGTMQGVAKMGMELFDMEVDKESSEGFERTGEYKGSRSYQRLHRVGDQSLAEIMLYVGDRFTVQIDAQNIEWERVEEALDALDIEALKAMAATDVAAN